MDNRLERIKDELKEWKVKNPDLAFQLSTNDAEYLIGMAELFSSAKLCQCPSN
jgi:hypothetical protein